jgi:hypothetical protein
LQNFCREGNIKKIYFIFRSTNSIKNYFHSKTRKFLRKSRKLKKRIFNTNHNKFNSLSKKKCSSNKYNKLIFLSSTDDKDNNQVDNSNSKEMKNMYHNNNYNNIQDITISEYSYSEIHHDLNETITENDEEEIMNLNLIKRNKLNINENNSEFGQPIYSLAVLSGNLSLIFLDNRSEFDDNSSLFKVCSFWN